MQKVTFVQKEKWTEAIHNTRNIQAECEKQQKCLYNKFSHQKKKNIPVHEYIFRMNIFTMDKSQQYNQGKTKYNRYNNTIMHKLTSKFRVMLLK